MHKENIHYLSIHLLKKLAFHIFTTLQQVLKNVQGILDRLPQIKTVIYAPFENKQKKLDVSKFGASMKSFDEVLEMGKKSNIKKNPNTEITNDTIAVIMYTSECLYEAF